MRNVMWKRVLRTPYALVAVATIAVFAQGRQDHLGAG